MNFEIVALSNSQKLAHLIAQQLGMPVIQPVVTRFADSEVEMEFAEPNRLKDKTVFIVHSTSTPVHDNVMQFLLLTHKVRSVGAQKIVGVMPYFGYSRQEVGRDKAKGSLEVIATLIQAAGVDELITVDFHAREFNAFFSIPVHNISTLEVVTQHCKKNISLEGACIVAPDKGSQDRAQALQQMLGIDYMGFTKERYAPDKTRSTRCGAFSHSKTAIIVDDIIDTGDTALNVCYDLYQHGCKNIYGYFVHPVLSADAVSLIEHSYFNTIFVSNSIELEQVSTHIQVFDMSPLLVAKIKEIIVNLAPHSA